MEEGVESRVAFERCGRKERKKKSNVALLDDGGRGTELSCAQEVQG